MYISIGTLRWDHSSRHLRIASRHTSPSLASPGFGSPNLLMTVDPPIREYARHVTQEYAESAARALGFKVVRISDFLTVARFEYGGWNEARPSTRMRWNTSVFLNPQCLASCQA